MNLSVNNLDLKVIPFSRRRSWLFIIEAPVVRGNDSEYGLFLSYSKNVPEYTARYEMIQIIPMKDEKPLPYTYEASPGMLTISAGGGRIDICFDNSSLVRLRAAGGLGLMFRMKFDMHEKFLDRLDGTVNAAFSKLGEYLFESVKGRQSHNGKWLGPQMKPADTDVMWTPEQDGALEGYIQHADYTVNRPEMLRDFDACAAESLKDFEIWCEKYEKVPEKYAQARLFSIYIIWISATGKRGHISEEMISMMRCGPSIRAMAWHQGYHAMAAYNDVDQAVRFLYSMFTVQDEFGQLPDSATDTHLNWGATKPPFQGFALNYLLDKVGIDSLTKEHCELLYEPMSKWINWWTTFRDRNNDGIVAYNHGDESGWDDASIFSKGLPLAAPDIAAFLVLCMEICSKLAGKLGFAAESVEWMGRSEAMLKKMIETFWNGDKFICLLDDTREVVDEESIAMYQPIILGKRLPQEIIDKIADTVSNPDKFFTINGFVSESMQSKYFDMSSGAFMLGLVVAPVQCMMTLGLYNAGHKELAFKNARNWCDRVLEVGPQAVRRDLIGPATPPYEGYQPIYPRVAFPGSLSSWGAAVFLILAHMLNDE